ncbi:MAG: hypothetical protein SFX72_13625 [Isosphaeraceae bacterium]|nr:hypothetical protein [Isosphaeraceae bacterium]
MACEKLCKAHLIKTGARPRDLQASHAYTRKHLPIVIRQEITASGQDLKRMQSVMTLTRHLAAEVELLNPAVNLGGVRPDNCEYPWESGDTVISPLDWTFHPLELVAVRGGPTFIKLLKGAIARTLEELEKSA